MKPLYPIDIVMFRGLRLLVLLALLTLPFAASATCTGKYASLTSYAGGNADSRFFADPVIAARFGKLPVKVRHTLKRNIDEMAVNLVGCHLVISGWVQRHTSETGAIATVDLGSGNVVAAIHSHGHIDVYLIQDPATDASQGSWSDVPKLVRNWAVLADMGFPHQQPHNVHMHPPAQ